MKLLTHESQLLNFYKMSFTLFSICSVFAVTILMPINLKVSATPTSTCSLLTGLYLAQY